MPWPSKIEWKSPNGKRVRIQPPGCLSILSDGVWGAYQVPPEVVEEMGRMAIQIDRLQRAIDGYNSGEPLSDIGLEERSQSVQEGS